MARITAEEKARQEKISAEILAVLDETDPAPAREVAPVVPTVISNEKWFPLGGVWVQVKSHRQEDYFKREFPTHPSYGKNNPKTIGLSGSYYKVGPEDFEKLANSPYRRHFTEMVRMNEKVVEQRWSMKG